MPGRGLPGEMPRPVDWLKHRQTASNVAPIDRKTQRIVIPLSSFHDKDAPHQVVAGAARTRALETETSLFPGDKADSRFALAPLRDRDIDGSARYTEAVIGIVTG